MDVALVNLWGIRSEQAFGGLCACLSGAENVCEQLHDDRLGRRDDIFRPGMLLALVSRERQRNVTRTRGKHGRRRAAVDSPVWLP